MFDTNVFVSALTFPSGRAAQAAQRIIDDRDLLQISKPIFDELLSVLARKFSRSKQELARVAVFLSDLGEIVDPTDRVEFLQDEPDNRVLECAVAGTADAMVTGDRAMLRLNEFQGSRIIALSTYLESS